MRQLNESAESANSELDHFWKTLNLQNLKYMDMIPIQNQTSPQSLVEVCAKLSLKPTAAEDLENDVKGFFCSSLLVLF